MTIQVKYLAQTCLRKSSRVLFAFIVALAGTRTGAAQIRYSRSYRENDSFLGLYIVGSIEFAGIPYNYDFQQQGNILSRGWAFNDGTTDGGTGLSFNLGLHYRLSDRIAIETGIQYNEMDLVVHDKRFMNSTGFKGDDGYRSNFSGTMIEKSNFDAADWYRSNYISCYYFIPSKSRTNLYFSGGIGLNFLTNGEVLKGTYYNEATNENLELTSHFKPFYVSSFIEAGVYIHSAKYRQPTSGGPVYFIGLKYYIAGNVISGDYQAMKNGIVEYSDHVNSDGSLLSLSVKIGGRIWGERSNSAHRDKLKKNHSSPKKKRGLPKEDESNTRGF